MPSTSCDTFLATLKKSGLLSSDQWKQATKAAESNDPKSAARQLMKEGLLTRWQANMLLAGKHTVWVGKYKLLKQIGRSSLSHVHLAVHSQMNRQVALKTLSQHHAKNPDSVKVFFAEARSVATLDHPNIVHVYDVDSCDDRYFLVMEHVEGDDLQNLVETNGPLHAQAVAEYLRQTADGLAYAHAQGIQHGDLNPSNVLLDHEKTIKIKNLGMMGLADLQESQQQSYRAPELADQQQAADVLCDIYSLGCVAYFLLTGKAPSEDGLDEPPALAEICNKMMAQSPQDRWATAEEVSQALAQWLSEMTPTKTAPEASQSSLLKRAVPLQQSSSDEASSASASQEQAKDQSALSDDSKIDPESDPPEEQEKRAISPRVLIAGAAAVGVLALVGVAVIASVAWFGSGGDDTLASEGGPALSSVEDKAAEEDVFSTLFELPPEALPADQRPDPSELDDTTTEQKPPAVKPIPKPPVKPPSSAPPKTDPPKTTPPKTTPSKPNPAKTDPPRTTTPKTDPPKTTPPKTDPPKPTLPDKPKPKVDPKPPPKPKPKPKPVKPFRELAPAVTLPAIAGQVGQPVALGTLFIADDEPLNVELSGGENAVRGRQTLSLQPGSSPREWEIHLNDSSKIDGGQGAVALLSVESQLLLFRWTDNAAKEPLANYLRNCWLTLRVGSAVSQLTLREPQEIEPLTVLFDRPARSDWKLDWLPNPDSIQVEFAGLSGEFPEHSLEPKKTLSAKDTTHLMVGDGLLSFKLDSVVKRNIQITATAYVTSSADQKSIRYNRAKIENAFAALKASQNQLIQRLKQLDMVTAEQKQDPQFKKVKDQTTEQLNSTLASIAKLEKFGSLIQSTNEIGQIHFRVYYVVGGRTVELARTAGAPDKAPPPGQAATADNR